ncbi:MAG: type II toxin-antitoxin system VapC family toxin [Nitrospira sp.]
MSKVLLDTDILIDILRGRAAVRTFLFDLTDHAVPCCSVMSVAELYAGMRPEEKRVTDILLDALVVIPVGQEIAEVAGRFKQRERSRRLELVDCVIAATAFVEGATLATGNTKDYPMPEITVINPRI